MSVASTVTLKAAPAVWVVGVVGMVRVLTEPDDTAKVPEVPVLPATALSEVTVKVVDWASERVMAAVACPEELKVRPLSPAVHDPVGAG